MKRSSALFIGILVLAAALAFIAIGAADGEPAEVLQKAVRVCLECMGIG